jgi:hypothetical protein
MEKKAISVNKIIKGITNRIGQYDKPAELYARAVIKAKVPNDILANQFAPGSHEHTGIRAMISGLQFGMPPAKTVSAPVKEYIGAMTKDTRRLAAQVVKHGLDYDKANAKLPSFPKYIAPGDPKRSLYDKAKKRYQDKRDLFREEFRNKGLARVERVSSTVADLPLFKSSQLTKTAVSIGKVLGAAGARLGRYSGDAPKSIVDIAERISGKPFIGKSTATEAVGTGPQHDFVRGVTRLLQRSVPNPKNIHPDVQNYIKNTFEEGKDTAYELLRATEGKKGKAETQAVSDFISKRRNPRKMDWHH